MKIEIFAIVASFLILMIIESKANPCAAQSSTETKAAIEFKFQQTQTKIKKKKKTLKEEEKKKNAKQNCFEM